MDAKKKNTAIAIQVPSNGAIVLVSRRHVHIRTTRVSASTAGITGNS